jgi:ribosomal protein S27AE
MICPECGVEMNFHAEKVNYSESISGAIDPVFGGVVEEAHTCPVCGKTLLRQEEG